MKFWVSDSRDVFCVCDSGALVKANAKKSELGSVLERLTGGEDPLAVLQGCKDFMQSDVDSIEKVELISTNTYITIHTSKGQLGFGDGERTEAAEVFEHLKHSFNLSSDERAETALEASLLPGFLFVMSSIAGGILSALALVGTNDGKARFGKAKALGDMIETLGPDGTVILSVAVNLGVLAFWGYKLMYRDKVQILLPESAAW